MEQLTDLADNRLIQGCLYCGATSQTREHVPSRILLQKPFPENLPVMPACAECNNSYSLDEEYVACVLGCMLSGTTEPHLIKNPRVSKALVRKPALRTQIEQSKVTGHDGISFRFDDKRFLNVIQKLAVGHAAFELSLVFRDKPTKLNWKFMSSMSDKELDEFDTVHVIHLLGEVGCRNIQRMYVLEALLKSPTGELVKKTLIINDWIDVQDGVYRYHALHSNEGVTIKIILNEYIACEIFWDY